MKSQVISETRRWLSEVVIGLNLCPFAKHPYTRDSIRYVVFEASDVEALNEVLLWEAQYMMSQAEEEVSTTLIIHPNLLEDFLDYNDYLGVAEDIIYDNGLEGKVQVASFHPDYQFAGTKPEDVENYTNRSPYPMLHLIREAQLERVLAHFPEPDLIPIQNIETMKGLGKEKIMEIWKRIKRQ
jgi:hypothetical protein